MPEPEFIRTWPRCRGNRAHDQFGHCRLAGTALTDQAQAFARHDFEANIINRDHLAVLHRR